MKILLINSKHYRRGGADVVYLNTGYLLEKKGNDVIYFSQKSKRNIQNVNQDYFIDEKDYFNLGLLKQNVLDLFMTRKNFIIYITIA